MPVNFSYVDVDPNDQVALDAIFELGKASILPDYAVCTPFPYPAKSRIAEVANDPDIHFITVYADGELRGAVAFRQDGTISLWIGKPWGTPEDVAAKRVDPRGMAQFNYCCSVIQDRCGQVISRNENPEARGLEARANIPVIFKPGA